MAVVDISQLKWIHLMKEPYKLQSFQNLVKFCNKTSLLTMAQLLPDFNRARAKIRSDFTTRQA